MRRGFILLGFLTLLGGCESVHYRPWSNGWQYGYRDLRLNEETVEVSYTGYNIPAARARDYALKRAAEVTLQGGFSHFEILAESGSASHQGYYSPGTSTTYATPTGGGGFVGTTYNSGVAVSVTRPATTLRIRPTNSPSASALDAQLVARQLSQAR